MKKLWVLPLLISLSGMCQASPWLFPDGKYKIDLPQGWPESPKASQRWSPGKDMFCELSASKQSRQEAANAVLSIQRSYQAKKQGKVQVTVGKLGNLDTWLVEAEPGSSAGHITIYYLWDGTVTRSVYLKTASTDNDRLKQERAAIVKSFSPTAPTQAQSPAAPSDSLQKCQAEFYKAFDEAADASERAQATEAYSYRLEKLRPHCDSENADTFLKAVASRVNTHASEAGRLLVHCKFFNGDAVRRAKEQNLLVPEALQSINAYANLLVKEFNEERDAEYRHQTPPPKTTRAQADLLQPGWAYRQGPKQYEVLQRTAYQQYRVKVQEFQPHPDPKKPQTPPTDTAKEVTMSGEELMCGQRIKTSAAVASRGSGLTFDSKPAAAVSLAPKKSAEEIYKVGYQAKLRGDYAEAIRLYQETLRCAGLTAADRSGIHSDMGVAYACWGKTNEAFSEYNLALSENPNNPAALYNRANAWLDRRNYQSALRDLEAAQRSAKTPEESTLIKKLLTQVREYMAPGAASGSQPSTGAQYNGSGQGMGGWKDAAELQRRTMETLERQRRENIERANQHPNRKY